MKHIYKILYIILFFVAGFLFYKYATYDFFQQEEFQLFVATLDNIVSIIAKPGGFIEICGLCTAQYYVYPIFGAVSNSLLIILCAIFCCKSLKQIMARWMAFGASIVVSIFLFKYHLELCYAIDGTYAILIMLININYILPLSENRRFDIISALSMAVVFWLTGQMVLLYTISLIVLLGLKKNKNYICLLLISIIGILFFIISLYGFKQIPLSKGFESIEFHLNQVIVSSYIYYVWIRFIALYLLAAILLNVSGRLLSGKAKIVVSGLMLIAAAATLALTCMPTQEKTYSRMTYYLNHLMRQEKWDKIISFHKGHTQYSSYNNFCLNYALARKGELGNKMFCFHQQGLGGLIPETDKKYLTNILLSDIFLFLDCPNVAESYLMEELTTARRYSNPRVMKNLIIINEKKGEYALADKYLDIMAKAPMYKDWAVKEKKEMNRDVKFANSADSLLSMINMEILLTNAFEKRGNKTAWEYLGASYLLARDNDKFCSFIKNTPLSFLNNLPTHFQEALLIFLGETHIPKGVKIDSEIIARYKDFLNLFEKKDMVTLYKKHNNTYWLYAINNTTIR